MLYIILYKISYIYLTILSIFLIIFVKSIHDYTLLFFLFILTAGLMLSITVLKLNTRVVPVAAPALLPTRTRTAWDGRRNLLVKFMLRSCFVLGGMVMMSPLGSWKSLASCPAMMAW